jgi:hypothetical protein
MQEAHMKQLAMHWQDSLRLPTLSQHSSLQTLACYISISAVCTYQLQMPAVSCWKLLIATRWLQRRHQGSSVCDN